jgi:phenylpropionate dioxygenase-like ring-hydroxylating dioxygenase large terminal subunit
MLPDEKEIIARLQDHIAKKSRDVFKKDHSWKPSIYTSQEHYEKERIALLRDFPLCIGPSQIIPEKKHSYILREIWNQPWIIWRTSEGQLRAYLNRCRHRGMKLLSETKGCTSKIVCPYHAWAYDQEGVCTFIPEQKEAFPTIELKQTRLKTREIIEQGGLIWLLPERASKKNFQKFLGPLQPHLENWKLQNHRIHSLEESEVNANWKLIHEAFLEAYHVPFIHHETLAPATISHTWLMDDYGLHSRAVYPLKRLKEDPNCEQMPLRRYTSIVYQIFPNTLISFQPFHTIVMSFWPIKTDKTRVQTSIMVSEEDASSSSALVDRDTEFVKKGLAEDFSTTEKIQEAISGGIEDALIAGRYEGQIEKFHRQLKSSQR